MKLVSLPIDNDLIEVHNNFLTGVETVYFNGHRVCRAFNFFSGVHEFRVAHNGAGEVDHYRVEFSTTFRKWYGCAIDIYKNGVCIHDESRRQPAKIFTLNVNGAPKQDRYNRKVWTCDAEPAPRPLYNESDLV